MSITVVSGFDGAAVVVDSVVVTFDLPFDGNERLLWPILWDLLLLSSLLGW
jgi:hypothetical protein